MQARAAHDGAIPFNANGKSGPSPPTLSPEYRGEGKRTALFCWEVGGGLGHLMQMLPLAEDLAQRGHRVFVALRQLERAAAVFGRAGVSFLQAPCWAGREDGSAAPFPRPLTFTQLLCNVGFGDDGELFGRACAWRNLFRMARPDLLVFDHSPAALLASRGLPHEPRRALLGSGFCCPPDDANWNANRTWAVLRPHVAVMGDPQRLIARVNRLLGKWKQPPLERLGQLYSDVDENFLTTLPELDHFRPADRGDDAAYWGPVLATSPDGAAPAGRRTGGECKGPGLGCRGVGRHAGGRIARAGGAILRAPLRGIRPGAAARRDARPRRGITKWERRWPGGPPPGNWRRYRSRRCRVMGLDRRHGVADRSTRRSKSHSALRTRRRSKRSTWSRFVPVARGWKV